MKKFIKISLLILLFSALLVGCSNGSDDSEDVAGVDEQQDVEEPFNIGIIQLVEHPALDASRDGFIAALSDAGYTDGEKINVDYQNGQNSRDTLNTISQKFVNDKADLIFAIATPAAQSAAQQTSDTPILITAVTDPVDAGIVNTMEIPGTNVSGTTDMNPIKEQLALIKEINPDASTVGIIYNIGEANSEVQVELAQSYADELGFEFELVGITTSSEVKQAAESLVNKIDAYYIPTDNTVISSIDAVLMVAEENKIPVISGESDSVKSGCLMTFGLNYYELGYQTGEMAVRIIEEGAVPAEMAVETQENMTLTINISAAERMGVEIPQALLDRADEIVE